VFKIGTGGCRGSCEGGEVDGRENRVELSIRGPFGFIPADPPVITLFIGFNIGVIKDICDIG
jgi:hypothetical protein